MQNKPTIVILDGYTTVQNDLSWNIFNQVANVVAYDRTPPEKIIERAKDADAVFTNKVPMFRPQIENLPKLKYIGVLATGYNNVDLQCAKERGIVATNIASYGTQSVAQAVFAHILNIANRTALHAESVHNGDWCKSADICYCLTSQTELENLTLGIIGFGAIGRKVAEIANGFGMKTIAFSPSRKANETIGKTQIKTIDEIFAQSDIISLNCPLNEKTEKIINAQNITKCKRGAWLINTGRGGLIDEFALADALKSGQIAYAGLDVLSVEPPTKENPLLQIENCFITPHNAWTSASARQRLINICFENFTSWLNGERPVKNSIIL